MAGPDPFPTPKETTATRCGVVGAGGHARVAVEALRRRGVVVEALFDRVGAAVVASDGLSARHDIAAAISEGLPLHVGIGSNQTRQRLAAEFSNACWLSVLDPRAMVAEDASWGDGCLIAMGAMVQARARFGRHAIVNTGAIAEHDVDVGDFAHLAPGSIVAGGCRVGEGALIGAGAVVLPGLSIGAWAVVGAGAVVTRSVDAGDQVAGNPARPMALST